VGAEATTFFTSLPFIRSLAATVTGLFDTKQARVVQQLTVLVDQW
jgi:hypothetical protein